jgi:small-conductance mechanosensitive channel
MPSLWSRWFTLLVLFALCAPVLPVFWASPGEAQGGPGIVEAGEAAPAEVKAQSLRSIAQDNFFFALFASMEKGSHGLVSNLESLRNKVLLEVSNADAIAGKICPQGRGAFLRFLATLSAITVFSLFILGILRRFLDRLVQRGVLQDSGQSLCVVKAFFARLLCNLFSLGIFFGVFFILLFAAIPGPSPERAMGGLLLIVFCYVLILQVFAGVLLAPGSPEIRLIPLSDAASSTLYRWLMAITWLAAVLGLSSMILAHIGGATGLGTALHASAGVSTSILLCAMILANRRGVSLALSGQSESRDFQSLLARHWHLPAMAYALFIGVFWSIRAVTVQEPLVRLVLSMFLIPVCVGLDLWVGRLLKMASREEAQVFSFVGDAGETELPSAVELRQLPRTMGFKEYYPLIHKMLRTALIVFPVFFMFRMWGVEIPVGWLFARDVLGILLVVVACLLIWEIISIRIDRHLQEEMALSGVNPEEMDEGGGAGGSRKATLLVLLRKFLMAVLVIMGTLMTLSALGVDIAPLIAGAGVVGLAIGFGAQTLVKDILSGIFFLIDDAFRVGDYVETGTAKGTVERISLRSMRLRHPRGMIYTVPFGGLKILQNYSRDYIVTKLDFRIRYDADIEKIRKVIKRVNKEILANEELKGGMLSDIKSNGVRGMEDSAMILRVKFKTVPGRQFVTRKEVYRRIQEAFQKNGIEFAHRNVTVYLPPEVQSLLAMSDGQKSAAGSAISGAAAAAVLLDEEEKARIAAEALAKAKGPSED